MRITLPETGYLRLSQIVGNPRSQSPHSTNSADLKKYVVGRCQVWPLSPPIKARPQNHRLASLEDIRELISRNSETA